MVGSGTRFLCSEYRYPLWCYQQSLSARHHYFTLLTTLSCRNLPRYYSFMNAFSICKTASITLNRGWPTINSNSNNDDKTEALIISAPRTSNSTSFPDSFVVEDSTVGVSLPAHVSMLTWSELLTLNCVVSAQYAITFLFKPTKIQTQKGSNERLFILTLKQQINGQKRWKMKEKDLSCLGWVFTACSVLERLLVWQWRVIGVM